MAPLEIMKQPAVSASRCGEIFVTNNADKWTFICSYCQKATTDIGVYICHIRLEHIKCEADLVSSPELDRNFTEAEGLHMPSTETNCQFTNEQESQNNFIKEEAVFKCSVNSQTISSNNLKKTTISSSTESVETESLISDKDSISIIRPATDIKEEYFTITPKDPDSRQEVPNQENEIVRVLYRENEKCGNIETIDVDDNESVKDRDTNSIYSLSGEDEDLSNEDAKGLETESSYKASSSKRRKIVQQDVQHICELCKMNFKFRSELDFHLKRIHNQKINELLRCKHCKKAFRSVAGLKYHLNSHDKKNNIQCPICQVKHTQNYYVAHVLTHESDTCFPCQVCGTMFTSNDDRVTHWKTHVHEMPFECDFCYRRFRKQQYLNHHLKSHFQYQCQFCPVQFNAVETQKPPYVCTTCENIPDIKKRVGAQRSLSTKHVTVFNPKPKFKS